MNQTAGARLKQIRLQKGLSLEAVQKQTKINAHIIQALEGDGISTVSPVYLRSFLKLYCAYLGVDPKEFSSAGEHYPAPPRREEVRYQQAPAQPVEQKKIAQPPPAPRPKEPSPAPVEHPVPRSQPRQQPPRPKPRHAHRIRKVSGQTFKKIQAYTLALGDVASQRTRAAYKRLSAGIRSVKISRQTRLNIARAAVALVALLIVAKIFAVAASAVKSAASKHKVHRSRQVSAQTQKKTPAPAVETPAEQRVAQAPSAQSEAARKAAETFAPQPKKAAESKIRLIIRARENSWVYLKSDGKVVFQRILEKGRFETWEAKERMELSVGNAGGVELDVNGKVFTNLGRRRQALKNIVITKDGLAINR